MAAIETLKEIDLGEAERLRAAGIASVEELWARIDTSDGNGIEHVAALAAMDADRLVQLLTAEGTRILTPTRSAGAKRNAIIAGMLLFCFAVLAGMMVWLASALGYDQPVVVAARDLPAGHMIQQGDLTTATLEIQADYFRVDQNLVGWSLAHPVAYGRPLRHASVLRPQIVAARDISSGEVVAREAVSLTWSAYHPGAAEDLKQVIDQKAAQPISKGNIVLSDFVTVLPDEPVVVVSAAQGLAPFHIISSSDVTVSQMPAPEGSFSSTDDVVGLYPSQHILSGTVLLRSQLSTVPITHALALADRQLLWLPLSPGAFDPSVPLPARVTLLLSPANVQPGAEPTAEGIFSDQYLLMLEHRDERLVATLAVKSIDLIRLNALLATSSVFVSRELP